MALNIGARSPGLSRLILRACRPASIPCMQTKRAESEARANVTCVVVGRQQQVNCGRSPSSSCLPACSQYAKTCVKLPGGMSGAHFSAYAKTAVAAVEREEEDTDFVGDGSRKLRTATWESVGAKEKLVSRPSTWPEERMLRGELLRSLREWPPDADLNEKLPNGSIGGKRIGVVALQDVLNMLTRISLVDPRQEESATVSGRAQREAFQLSKGTKYWCSTKDALRALNALKWWLSRNPEDPRQTDKLFNPVLQALSQARLTDAISRLLVRYGGPRQFLTHVQNSEYCNSH